MASKTNQVHVKQWINTLRPRFYVRRFADDLLKCILHHIWYSHVIVQESIKLMWVSCLRCHRLLALLVQVMACRLFSSKQLPKTMPSYSLLYIQEHTSLNFELQRPFIPWDVFKLLSVKCHIWHCVFMKWCVHDIDGMGNDAALQVLKYDVVKLMNGALWCWVPGNIIR